MYHNSNYITPYKVNFPPEIIFPSGETNLTLTAIKEVAEYQNGKPTDKIIGTRFTGITPEGKLTSVKVLSNVPLNPEEFHLNLNTSVTVHFSGVVVKVYVNKDGRAEFSVQAESVEVLK